jgi:hypothetical protein
MAKAQLRTYIFTPGTAGAGTVQLPGKVDLSQILLITNTTKNVIIYNFADSTFAGTAVTFTRSNSINFPTALQNTDGYTTVVLPTDTSSMSASDTLQVLYEQPYMNVKIPNVGTDAFERIRVSPPQSMLDADFEYGLQTTKWQTYDLMRGYPSIYEVPGTDQNVLTVVTDASTGNVSGTGASLITITTTVAHGFIAGNPIIVKGYLTTVSGFSRAEGSFLITSVPSPTTLTYYAKAQVGSYNGQILNTVYTVLRKGGLYTGSAIGYPTLTYNSATTPVITATFTTPHGLIPGQTINVQVTSTGNTTTVTPTISGVTGQFTIVVGSNASLIGGMSVTGTGIGSGAVITSIAGTTVTLSVANSGTVSGTGTFVYSNNLVANGAFFVETVPNNLTITYTARAAYVMTGTLVANIYVRPDCFYLHRPFDGGVMLSTGGPAYGSLAVRMSKKYIRYQSGKAINYNTAALFSPSYDIRAISASGTGIGSVITVTTDNVDHGFQVNAYINIYGVTSTGYNGYYYVASIIDERNFTVLATQSLQTTTPTFTDPCQVSLINWYGSTVRAGTFDDQNGIYIAYDGQTMYAGLRYSTFQIAGTITVTTDSNTVVGSSTRFTSQLTAGDKIVIKGMTHVVTSVVSDTLLYMAPDYRGFGSTSTTATGTSGQSVITVASYTGLTVGMNVSGTGIGTNAVISSLTSGTITTTGSSVSLSFTGNTTATGVSLISLTAAPTGITVGMNITGTSIPTGTTITAVDAILNTISISQNVTAQLSSTSLTVGGNAITVSSTTGIIVGSIATQTNIPGNTSVVSISGTTLVLSANYTNTITSQNIVFTDPYIITLSVVNSGAVSGTINFTTTYAGIVATKTLEIIVPQNQWNVDRCDGSISVFNPSGYNLVVNKAQMIGLQWTWYGAGFIDYMLRGPDGNYMVFHRIKNSNINTLAYMRSGNQPTRYEVQNDGISRLSLAAACGATDTVLNLSSSLGLPYGSLIPPAGVTMWLDGELVTYTGITQATIMLATATNSTNNTVTVATTANLTVNQAVVFTGTVFGGISAGQTYFISSIPTSGVNGTIQLATSYAGSVITLTTVPSGSMTLTSYPAVTGVARGISYSEFTAGQSRTFTGGPSTSHAAGTGIVLTAQTATPLIQHWGSAYLQDGGFDSDRGYIFNYQAPNITISTKKTCAFAIRLAPSVSNGLTGDLGIKDLINRAQLLLQTIEITSGGTTNINSATVVEAVLNPQNFPTNPSNITWNNLYGTTYSGNLIGSGQPSFSQIAPGPGIIFDSQNTVSSLYTTGANIGSITIFLNSDPIAAGVQVGDDVFIPGATSAVYGNTKVTFVQTSPALVTISNALLVNIPNGTTFNFSRYTYAVPGETVFSFISSPANKDSLDLTPLKELTATPIGGRGCYPNGPDTLFVNVYLTQGTPVLANLVLRWGEAQA